MAENVQITPGSGVTIGADSVTDITLGSAQIQYIKIMDGTIGGTNKAAVTANGLAIDGSGVTQPISAISLPLPTGAATSSNQSSEISLLTTIASNTANASTPTVSGTVTVLQPTAANLNATVTQTTAADLVTESWLNDGSGNAISSTSGSLDVQVSNFPATQTVAGTVIANAGTGTFQTNVTNASIPVTESGIWNITNITGSISLPTGAATEATLLDVKSDLDQFTFSANGLLVDGSGVTQPVSGTITAQQSVAANLLATVYLNDGSGNPISSTTGSLNVNVTNASGLDTVNQGNPNTLANAWPVELSDGTNLLGTSSHPVRVDPTGTTTQPISGSVSVSNFPATQPISGTVTANAGTGNFTVVQATASSLNATVTGTVIATQATGTNLHTVVDSGSITVANATLAVTQSTSPWVVSLASTTITGTVAVTQSGTWNLNNISGTISLPTGASTAAKQPALGVAGTASTDVITVQGIASMTALKVDGSAVTQPISGTVSVSNFPATQVVSGTGTFTVGQATGTNLHTVVDSGSITVANATLAVTQSTSPWVVSLASTTITGTVTVAGNLTHNNAAPAANNIGVLPAVASTAAPTYNAGDQVLLSTDLSGNLRVTIDSSVAEQNVNLNQVGGSTISIGQATMAASLPVVLASNQSSIPVTLASTTITGTVAVTQSTSPWVVSGTVTSNIGTTGGLALDTSVNGILLAQGSTTSGEKGPLIQGAVTTSSPSYTTAETSPLSLTLAGALRIDGSAVTQPVSLTSTTITGTVAVTQSTSPWVISGTVTTTPPSNASTNITEWDSTALGAPSAYGTSPGAVNVIGVNAFITNTPTVTANQGTAASAANKWPIEIVDSGGTNVATVTGAGAVKVDGSAVTQPVSGTVTANQATAANLNATVVQATPANLQATVTQQTITKGTQGSTGVTTQDLKDSGRTFITFTADAIAGVTTEALVTFTLNKAGTATAAQTNYTITSGKTLRIQVLSASVQAGAAAGEWARAKLRINTAGATTATSPLVITVEAGSAAAATATAGSAGISIPDGLEIVGNGTITIGLSHLSSATTNAESITLIGYEY